MIVHIDKSFDKDVSKVKITSIRKKIAAVIEQVMAAKKKRKFYTLRKFKDMKPIIGYELGIIE